MSSQDRLENVLRDIHIMISRSEAYDAERIIVSKNVIFDLIDRLNASVYEIMDDYELTQQSRDHALREHRREGEKIIQNASHQAEDIYAASVMYTEEALNHLHGMIEEADATIGRLYRRFQRDMKQQEETIRENHLELKSQLQLLADTKKYLRLIEERNREIERERKDRKGRKILEKQQQEEKRKAFKPDIKINEEYFRKAGIPLEKEEEPEPVEALVMEPLEDEGVIDSTLRKAEETNSPEAAEANIPDGNQGLEEGRRFGERPPAGGNAEASGSSLEEGRRFGERPPAGGNAEASGSSLEEGHRFGERPSEKGNPEASGGSSGEAAVSTGNAAASGNEAFEAGRMPGVQNGMAQNQHPAQDIAPGRQPPAGTGSGHWPAYGNGQGSQPPAGNGLGSQPAAGNGLGIPPETDKRQGTQPVQDGLQSRVSDNTEPVINGTAASQNRGTETYTVDMTTDGSGNAPGNMTAVSSMNPPENIASSQSINAPGNMTAVSSMNPPENAASGHSIQPETSAAAGSPLSGNTGPLPPAGNTLQAEPAVFSQDAGLGTEEGGEEPKKPAENIVKVNLDAEYFKWKKEEQGTQEKPPQHEKVSLLDKLMGRKKTF